MQKLSLPDLKVKSDPTSSIAMRSAFDVGKFSLYLCVSNAGTTNACKDNPESVEEIYWIINYQVTTA